MATYIVGARKPAKLGTNVDVPQALPASNAMWYVVARNCAFALQGYSANKTRNFTMYGCYKTEKQAKAHIAARKMGLYACAVCL